MNIRLAAAVFQKSRHSADLQFSVGYGNIDKTVHGGEENGGAFQNVCAYGRAFFVKEIMGRGHAHNTA